MGRIYRDALGKLSSASVGVMRADQVQWLAWVQQVCHADDPAAAAPALVSCLQPLYNDRIKLLRIAVVRRDGISFLTRTQYLAMPKAKPEAMGSPEFPGFGTLQASWPVADTSNPQWAAWNRAMESNANLFANGKAGAVPNWTADLAEGADTAVTLQLKRTEHDRITVSMNMDSMGHGAAHPNEAFGTLTWLLQAERPLRADDVFAPGEAWRQVLAKACWKAISTGKQAGSAYPEVKGPDAKPLLGVVENVQNWTLEADGLHISYPEYSVSPRAAPLDDTVIPWAVLRPVLASGFVAP